MDAIKIVEEFKGEYFSDYANIKEYVEMGAWEKDYFSAWLASCSDYPTLREIENFCKQTTAIIEAYLDIVE